jgi:hypothetical protein
MFSERRINAIDATPSTYKLDVNALDDLELYSQALPPYIPKALLGNARASALGLQSQEYPLVYFALSSHGIPGITPR